ncbi:hypothetical protein KSP40_PGU019998 [Platanthera guangdongensis]|uniref:Uncharacterized protein n=1 Tax=Platanthera guangdongensis TaxID=2320717 RepID=A0ABR2MBL4_9ASPA
MTRNGLLILTVFMQTFFDDEIHKMNVNTSFIPTFVSLDFLQTINDDIKFLYPKVCTDVFSDKIDINAYFDIHEIRELIAYGYIAKQIKSHRDLPFRLNE